jgi:hypothetical protein
MLPIENSFIFPGLDKYSVMPVLEQTDERSVVILSGVNREACQFLSNDGYFKQRVAFAFPKLMAIGFTFPTLCGTYPPNGWKLLFCSSQKGELDLTFLKASIPFLLEGLKEKKAVADRQIQWICGSGDDDSESLINKAGVAFKQAESDMLKIREAKITNEEWLDTERSLALMHDGPELNAVMNFFESNYWLLLPNLEEHLFERANHAQVPLCRNLLPCYRSWFYFYLEDLKATDKMKERLKTDQMLAKYLFFNFEDKRSVNCEIALLQDPLKWMEHKSMQAHPLELQEEFEKAISVERQLDAVASCVNFINKIEEGQLKPTPEVGNELFCLICSFPALLQSRVWSKLFQTGMIPSWNLELCTQQFNASFPQCLGELRSILSSIPKELVQATAN